MPNFERLTEHTISTENVYDGALLRVNRDMARLPDGRASVREWIAHPGASAVVPVWPDGTTLLLAQYRYPPKRLFHEVPAGKLDPGDSPESCARRELAEEAGLAGDLHYIGYFYPGIGYSDEVIHIWAATNLHEVPAGTDEDEFVEPYRLPLAEAVARVHAGDIVDGKTAICLLRVWEWWNRR